MPITSEDLAPADHALFLSAFNAKLEAAGFHAWQELPVGLQPTSGETYGARELLAGLVDRVFVLDGDFSGGQPTLEGSQQAAGRAERAGSIQAELNTFAQAILQPLLSPETRFVESQAQGASYPIRHGRYAGANARGKSLADKETNQREPSVALKTDAYDYVSSSPSAADYRALLTNALSAVQRKLEAPATPGEQVSLEKLGIASLQDVPAALRDRIRSARQVGWDQTREHIISDIEQVKTYFETHAERPNEAAWQWRERVLVRDSNPALRFVHKWGLPFASRKHQTAFAHISDNGGIADEVLPTFVKWCREAVIETVVKHREQFSFLQHALPRRRILAAQAAKLPATYRFVTEVLAARNELDITDPDRPLGDAPFRLVEKGSDQIWLGTTTFSAIRTLKAEDVPTGYQAPPPREERMRYAGGNPLTAKLVDVVPAETPSLEFRLKNYLDDFSKALSNVGDVCGLLPPREPWGSFNDMHLEVGALVRTEMQSLPLQTL